MTIPSLFFTKKPLVLVALVLITYAAWFILPVFFIEITDTPATKVLGIKSAITQFGNEAIVAIVLALLITYLGWWRKIGFQSINPGGLKFLLPPIMLVIIMTAFIAASNPEAPGILGFTSLQQFVVLLLMILLLGFNEELIFRGITFFGLRTVYSPIIATIMAALIFGIFHYVNLFNGQEFPETSYQVLHAAAAGFMYGALRLRIGAIWPVMLFHGFWDMSLFEIQTMNLTTSTALPTTTHEFQIIHALLLMLPALLYGTFVCWRWWLWDKKLLSKNR